MAFRCCLVASFTDAWIETKSCGIKITVCYVASFTDAWIETSGIARGSLRYMSHLLQMRGLKHLCPPSGYHHYVASFTDAWIETFLILILSIILWSHLLQMRGLKPNLDFETTPSPESHLLQMRGLKLTRRLLKVVLMCRIFYRCVD